MKLSEKIYTLRKNKGLSQEQLAEELSVSRQAISKWESGVSVPESEKLIAISTYFNVSVDYLVKDDIDEISDSIHLSAGKNSGNMILKYVGLSICILGFLCLVAWGIIMIADPRVSDNVANSSMITIDGRGVLLLVCIILVALGVVLLLKKHNRR